MFKRLSKLAVTLLAFVFGAVLSLSLVQHAAAQAALTWPHRTVKFIVPLGPGSGVDIGARLLAEKLRNSWGHPVVIENRPGGDGLVSVSSFLSANDDHVLLFATPGSFVVHPYQYEKLPYDFERDLIPIARFANTVIALAASTDINAATLEDLVARLQAEPGKLNYAVPPGIGEFYLEGFLKAKGLIAQRVPYRDVVQAASDLAAGRLQFMMGGYAILRSATQTSRAKMIAVTSSARMPLIPDVATAAEQNVPQLSLEGLSGLFGPRGFAEEAKGRIANDVAKAATDPELVERLLATGQTIDPGGPTEFEVSIREQSAQVAALAKRLDIRPK